jgi:outer membrane lipoprotein-sorting protein
MTSRGLAMVAVVLITIIAALAGPAIGDPASRAGDRPPAKLTSGEPTHDVSKIEPVFSHFKVDRLSCKFTEEKHIALLARPLKSTGTIYFDHDKGIARTTLTPKHEQVVLTTTSLRIRKNNRTEEIPLDKSKDLKAFALIFPTLLRGNRAELERAFDIGLYGSDVDWWALVFTPKAESLRALVRRVVVVGRKAELVSLQISEASGDTTDTQLTDVARNGDVPDADIATAFGAQ